MSRRRKSPTIDELILEIVEKEHPQTVKDLVKHVQGRKTIPTEKLIEHITRLHDRGKIKLETPMPPTPDTLTAYLTSRPCRWFWAVVGLVFFTMLAIFTISPDMGPIAYLRWALSFIFILFLPGYCFIETLFPDRKDLDDIERFTLSVGSSIAISPLTALALNFTPFGIRLTPVLTSLACVTMLFACTAVFRKFSLLSGKGK